MNNPIENKRLLSALKREPLDYPPIWLMRQAGRYLPEYLASRRSAGSFMELCRNKDFATEVTLQPIDRYGLDAAILFSDILTIPDALGLELHFVEGEGPAFNKPLRTAKDITQLSATGLRDKLSYVADAVQSIKQALNARVPLIGFSGSPFTLACYMLEGRGGEFVEIKKMLFSQPSLLHTLLETLSDCVADYLLMQIGAGADVVQLFDTWGGLLATHHFDTFDLPYLKNIVKRIKAASEVPVIVFTKGGGNRLRQLSRIGADCVGLDWQTDVRRARQDVADGIALQGNLDPLTLLGTPEQIIAETKRCLDDFAGLNGHVFNLGHGISRFTPPENVQILIDTVRSYQPQNRLNFSHP